jgi:hypothetical protein
VYLRAYSYLLLYILYILLGFICPLIYFIPEVLQ